MIRKLIALFTVSALLLLAVGCGAGKSGDGGKSDGGNDGNYEETVPGDFFFTISWEVYGTSSYDSKTGALVKTDAVADRENYITVLEFGEEEMVHIYGLIASMHPFSYPDEYDPGNGSSGPTTTVTLTVRMFGDVKTIRAENISRSFSTEDDMGQLFLDTIREIAEMIAATEEWNSLPSYPMIEI